MMKKNKLIVAYFFTFAFATHSNSNNTRRGQFEKFIRADWPNRFWILIEKCSFEVFLFGSYILYYIR